MRWGEHPNLIQLFKRFIKLRGVKEPVGPLPGSLEMWIRVAHFVLTTPLAQEMHSATTVAPRLWGYTTFYLSSHQLVDICALSNPGLL